MSQPDTTILCLRDSLPLTCSREGTCCHGKMVWLNPWELARLSASKGMIPREFRDLFCEFGGIRLRFNGSPGWKGMPACSQYDPQFGCNVHDGRPLVCRLYPLGRQLYGEKRQYIHRGSSFPCLEGCPKVTSLPTMTVSDYLLGQNTSAVEKAQDAYLDLMQELADGAFALLLETGLAASGDRLTLRLWRSLGSEHPERMTERLGSEWIDRLMIPEITDADEPTSFSRLHFEMLQAQAQASFGALDSAATLREASGLMMGLALHLGRGLGANPAELAEKWIATANEHGARE